MNELQLRDRALEIARTTPGDLLENAEKIYQWLIQTSAVKQGEVVFLPPAATEVAFSDAVSKVNENVGVRVMNGVASNLVEGTALVRR